LSGLTQKRFYDFLVLKYIFTYPFNLKLVIMKKAAFKMKLKPGYEEEYRKRHSELWPELKQALEDAGILEYGIYLDRETGTLFALQKLEDGHSTDELPGLAVMKKWWDYMKDIMEVNPDNSPVVTPLEEMFEMK
jgi:L-rhamnose mutarotase